MGYLNPALQFGMENFLKSCKAVGIDGLILPDLPLEVYNKHYKSLFEEYGISMIFIITPETNAARIQEIDQASSSFIYAVSSSSITGKALDMNEERLNYFKRLKSLQTQHPILLGFGIRDRAGFVEACSYTKGGIIGSACIEFIKKNGIHKLNEFVNGIIES
jgi:tryptophan synthase alpha chain